MSDQPGTSIVQYVTVDALERSLDRVEKRIEDHNRDERTALEKRIEREIVTLRAEGKAAMAALSAEYKAEVAAFRALSDQASQFNARALELQTAANADHFKLLNNSEARASAEQARTVPILAFEEYKKTQTTALDALAKEQQNKVDTLKSEEATYRKGVDERLSKIDLILAAHEAKVVGGKDATSGIRSAIVFAIAVLAFIAGYVIPLLSR